MENVPSTNNSLTQFLEQLLRIQKNSMEIVGKLTEVTTSTADTVTIQQEDQYGTVQNYELPTIGALKNDISRIDNNFNSLIGQNGESVTVRLADGSFRKIIQANLFKEPKKIGTLLVPSVFNRKNNWFFESFLNPLLYVSFDISNYVEYNTQQVSYKRMIINCDTDEKKQYFDSLLKSRNDIDYDTLLKDLSSRNINYFVDEDIANLPVSIARYSGTFDVISYKDETVPVVQTNGTTIEEKVRKYQLNTLKYTDNLQNFKNTEILKPGDSLEVGQSTRYQITTVDNSNNSIIVKMTSGTESIPTGTDVLRVSTDSFAIKEVQINIGFDERQIIFIKAIDRDTNLTTRDFSPGVAFYSNDLVITTSTGDSTLESFYKRDVMDFGSSIMSLAKEGTIPAVYGEIPDAPRLTATDFQVVLVNEQKFDTDVINQLKSKIAQKNTIYSEINQLQTAIDKKRQEFNTSKFNSDAERQAVQNQLENLIRQKTSSSNLYASIVADLSSTAKNLPPELANPKYSIRGFFPIPKAKPSAKTLDQEVIQFLISWRYLRKDGTAVGITQLDFTDNNGEKVRGYFSNWNEQITKIRPKVYDDSLGIYVWSSEDVQNGDQINVNQIDIPISKGEQVEIRVKSIGEAGWPTNPITSEWSSSITIPFPDNLSADEEVLTSLSSSSEEETRVNFNQDLAARGLDTHLSSSFIQKDKYFPHSSTGIASGFFGSDGSVIDLFQKLTSMDNEIATLKAIIEKAKGKLSVYIIDPNGTKYNVANNSLVDLFAGYYYDIVNALPTAEQKGAIISSVYKLAIQNTAVSTLQLVSQFPGGLDVDLPDHSTSSNTDYQLSRQYDVVPLSVASVDANKTDNSKPYQAPPFQSAQRLSQYLYLRATDIGLKNFVVGTTGTGASANSYWPVIGGTATSFVWDSNPVFSTPNGNGGLSNFCVHTDHPDLVSGATFLTLTTPPGVTGATAVYPKLVHSKFFNKQSFETNGKVQAEYIAPDVTATNLGNRYPVKLGFYTNDRYLIGENTCGSYLFLSPSTYNDLLVDGTDFRAVRNLEFGEDFQITIPIIFQFRMTDYFGAGSAGTGRIGGSSSNIKNLFYTKKIGVDIYAKDESVFSFDLQVSAKYKVDSPSQTSISPAQNTKISSSQSQTFNQIF